MGAGDSEPGGRGKEMEKLASSLQRKREEGIQQFIMFITTESDGPEKNPAAGIERSEMMV